MILVGITLLLAAALTINHAVHGFGCWGLQSGGPASGLIYDLQILAAVIGVAWLLIALARQSVPFHPVQILAIALFGVASIVTFQTFGWRAHTSIHYQGAENLLAYVTVAATTFLVGRYGPRREPTQTECDHQEANQDKLPPSQNPYEPPRDGGRAAASTEPSPTLGELFERYKVLATRERTAQEFYRLLEADGVQKLNAMALLRDLYNLNLMDCKLVVEGGSPSEQRSFASLRRRRHLRHPHLVPIAAGFCARIGRSSASPAGRTGTRKRTI